MISNELLGLFRKGLREGALIDFNSGGVGSVRIEWASPVGRWKLCQGTDLAFTGFPVSTSVYSERL